MNFSKKVRLFFLYLMPNFFQALIDFWRSLTMPQVVLISLILGVFGLVSYSIKIIGFENLSSLTSSPSLSCDFYSNAAYISKYPYIVIDPEIRSNRYIRAIATEAIWETAECERNGEFVELYGTEKTLHRIEFRLEGDLNDYKHVADGLAVYRSKVIFDNKGKIIKRIILDKPEKPNYKSEHIEIKLRDLTLQKGEDNHLLNYLVINPTKEIGKNLIAKPELNRLIEEYAKIRAEMHLNELSSKNGCDVITSIENSYKKPKLSTIAFLCPTHARIMVHKL